jgi:hypothetical protein
VPNIGLRIWSAVEFYSFEFRVFFLGLRNQDASRVQGSGIGVRSSGFRVQDSWFGVRGSGFRVQDSGFRVHGSGFRV